MAFSTNGIFFFFLVCVCLFHSSASKSDLGTHEGVAGRAVVAGSSDTV